MGDWIIPLVTLTGIEVVLGIDNIIFLAILAGRLPEHQRAHARRIGLILALGTRLLLLFSIQWVMSLQQTVFTLPEWTFSQKEAREISWKDLILLAGGLFLIAKSTFEIHHRLEEKPEKPGGDSAGKQSRFISVLVQIAILDIVFSLDSVITAVGMVQQVGIIVAAMILTVLVMLLFAGPVGDFVERHPTLKVLALSFLILIGVVLVAEGMGQHFDKGYIYFAMGFAFTVEMINLKTHSGRSSSSESPAE
ncbi:MAG: TerC family protein [Gemmataceae bacterium]|nr:TerC family protein [Gemmataceae bacterium]